MTRNPDDKFEIRRLSHSPLTPALREAPNRELVSERPTQRSDFLLLIPTVEKRAARSKKREGTVGLPCATPRAVTAAPLSGVVFSRRPRPREPGSFGARFRRRQQHVDSGRELDRRIRLVVETLLRNSLFAVLIGVFVSQEQIPGGMPGGMPGGSRKGVEVSEPCLAEGGAGGGRGRQSPRKRDGVATLVRGSR